MGKKDVIQNDLFSLCKYISDTFYSENFGNINLNIDSQKCIKRLTSIKTQKELDCLLEVFKEQKKSKITKSNLEFIIYNSDLLDELFFEEGKMNKEKLKLLDPPYDVLLNVSHIFAKYCLEIDLKDSITEKSFNAIYDSFKAIPTTSIIALEKCITNNNISIMDITKSCELFFKLYRIYDKLFYKLDLDILITTTFSIYEKTIPESALSGAYSYLHSIEYLTNHPEKNCLNNMHWFLENFEYCGYNTLKLLNNLYFWYSKIFDRKEKKEILTYMLNSENEYYPLMLKSGDIALKFYLYEKETGKKPCFHILNNISTDI